MKRSILIIGYGISGSRVEAVSKNSLSLKKTLQQMGYQVHIVNVGYDCSQYGISMLDAIIQQRKVRKNIATYIKDNRIDIVIDTFVLPLASLMFIAPLTKLAETMFIKEIHNDFGASRKLHAETVIRWLANNKLCFNQLFRIYDKFFTRNLEIAQKYKITYLPTPMLMNAKRANSVTHPIRVCYLGHPLEKKGVYEFPKLITSLKKVDASEFSFQFAFSDIGDKEKIIEKIRSAARAQGIKVTFSGKVKPHVFFRNNDIYLLPIHDNYGAISTPNTILEAMEAGCLVLVTDISSIRGIIKNGETGVLLSDYRANVIYKRLIELKDRRMLIKRICSNARALIENEYQVKNLKDALEHLL